MKGGPVMRLVLALAGAVALALVPACSGDADEDGLDLGTTTSAANVTTTLEPSTTAAVPSTTTVPPTTTVLATTIPEPTTTTATDPTTTVTAAETDVSSPSSQTPEEKVAADYNLAREARQDCAFDPSSCDYSSIAVPNSPMDLATRTLMGSRIQNNLRAVAGHGDVSVRIEAVAIEGSSAYVTICGFDTLVIFDVVNPSNPNDDIVFNEAAASYRVKWQMLMNDGNWLLYDSAGIDELKDGDLCGF